MLFTLSAGIYSLQEGRKCSNYKLLSYGDFSTENMRATWNCNSALADIGRSDMQIMQEVFLELGQLHYPDEPNRFKKMYFHDISVDGLTKQEIEIALSRKALEQMLAKARQAHEKAEAERQQSGMLLALISAVFEEVHRWKQERANSYNGYRYDDENEFGL